MRLPLAIFSGVAVSLLSSYLGEFALGEDWPQWRGPNRDGVSQETGLLQEWPAEGPPLLWRIDGVGEGYSTPALAEGKLYLISSRGNEIEEVRAFEAGDGKSLWTTPIGKVGHLEQQPPYPGARSTPTVDGDRLYALGSDGDLACLEVDSGKIVWSINIRTEFGGQYGEWAYSESPLVDGDKLICTPGGEKATMLALDKESGKVVWQSAIPGGDQAGYASPIAIEVGGVKQYVQFLQNGVVGVEAETGKFLWRDDRTAQGSPANIPTPVADDGLVYTGTNRGGGGLAKLSLAGEEFKAEPVYFSKELPTSIGGSVKVGDYLYGTNGGGLICVEFATGDVKWRERSIGAASTIYADGRLYMMGEGQEGAIALVEATPEAYREKGRFSPPDQPDRGKSRRWTYPVIANGKLYVRDLDVMWCYDIEAKP